MNGPARFLLLSVSVMLGAACRSADSDLTSSADQGLDLSQDLRLDPIYPDESSSTFIDEGQAMFMAQGPGESTFYVGKRAGVIVALPMGAMFDEAGTGLRGVALDLRTSPSATSPAVVDSTAPMMGLLGMAFDPKIREGSTPFVYVAYTAKSEGKGWDPSGRHRASPVGLQLRVSRFEASEPGTKGRTFSRQSEVVLLKTEIGGPTGSLSADDPLPSLGGSLTFGSDGDLYVGIGDSDVDSDGGGKILRIDVGDAPPMPATGGALASIPRELVYAEGFHNPRALAFDGAELWVDDNGGDRGANVPVDEINRVVQGGDYGWPRCAGTLLRDVLGKPCNVPSARAPFLASDEIDLVGGLVYRGHAIPKLQGAYIFADRGGGPEPGAVYALDPSTGQRRVVRRGNLDRVLPGAIAEDESGELYVIERRGALFRVQRAEAPAGDETHYRFLTRTGIATVDNALGYYKSLESPIPLQAFIPSDTSPLSSYVAPGHEGVSSTDSGTTLNAWVRAFLGIRGADPADLAADANKLVTGFYRNTSDLGFWREMVCTKVVARGAGGCFVRNWNDESRSGTNAGVVGMNITHAGAVQFFAFAQLFGFSDGQGPSDVTWLLSVARLDNEGPKAPPSLCTPCHGGFYAGEGHPNMGSIFREFEPGLLQRPHAVTVNQMEEQWHALNEVIRGANRAVASEAEGSPSGTDRAKAASLLHLDQMYPTGTPPAVPFDDDSRVPPSWRAQPGESAALSAAKTALYKKVIAKYCAQCHRSNRLALDDYGNFDFLADGEPTSMLQQYLSLDGSAAARLPVMPHSEVAYEKLRADAPAVAAVTAWVQAARTR